MKEKYPILDLLTRHVFVPGGIEYRVRMAVDMSLPCRVCVGDPGGVTDL